MEVQKWKKKKEKAQAEGNIDSVFTACKELAQHYFSLEKYDLALQEYKEVERIAEQNGNKIDVGWANRMIGEVYCEKGEFEKAIKHQQKHLVISRDERNKVEEQRALATLGRTYFLQAETVGDSKGSGGKEAALNQAHKFYMESLAICEQLTDNEVGHRQRMEMIGRLFLNIGLVLDGQNHFESSINHLQKAISISKKLDLWEDLYRTYSALGAVFHKFSNLNQAIKTYDLALDIAERLSDKAQFMCDVLLLKADVLIDLPDARGARQVLIKAYRLRTPSRSAQIEIEKKLRIVAVMCECENKLAELSPDSDHSERKSLYEEMGDAAAELGKFKLALTYYHLMLECVKKTGNEQKALIDSYISLAQTYKDDQQLNKALEFFQKEFELEAPNSVEGCKTLLNIAEVYQLMGRKSEMYATFKEAKSLAYNLGDMKLKKVLLTALYSALIDDNKISEAEIVKRDLNAISEEIDDFSSDDESPRVIGAHISLDDLSDEEGGGGAVGDKEELSKQRRARTRKAPNIEKRNAKGETPLHLAAINGNFLLAKKLVEQGHRVDVKDYSGWTPLHEACNFGNSEIVTFLLEHGAPVNDRGGAHCDGVTPLLDAATNGNLEIMELLLQHGASPLMRTNKGETVLDCLSGWRRRRFEELNVDLDSALLSQYSAMYNKLSKVLQNAGQISSEKNSSLKSGRESETSRDTLYSQKIYPKKAQISSRKTLDSSLKKTPPSNQKLSSGFCKDDSSGISARDEYESTMKALRCRNIATEETKDEVEIRKVVRGLVRENEIVDDDWLEDDISINRPNKKRRTGEYHQLIGRTSRGSAPSYSPTSDSGDELPQEDTEANVIYSDSSSVASVTCGRSNEQMLSTKNQSTFLPPNSDVFIGDKARTDYHSSNYQPPMQSHQSLKCVKVRIEDKVVMIPVIQDGQGLTISWLAKEAAERYKSLEGVEPVIQLEMEGGGILIGSDPLSIISHSPSSLVEARVLSWKVSSLAALYQEACDTLHSRCDKKLKSLAEDCEGSCALSMEDMYLSWPTLSPLIRALSHYHYLQSLSLSSNNISDTNIQEVGDCIAKLHQLKILDISNINITDKGLDLFVKSISKNNGLKMVDELRMGYNPLGDCLRPLTTLLDCTVSLRHLSIPNVGLTEASFYSEANISLGCLEVLDVNYNEIGRKGVISLLGSLNSDVVTELSLAGTGQGVVREIGYYMEQKEMPNLHSIDLSYCQYTLEDIKQFQRGAEKCRTLERVSLDGCAGSYEGLLSLSLQELSVCCGKNNIPSVPAKVQRFIFTTPYLHRPVESTSALIGPYGLVISERT